MSTTPKPEGPYIVIEDDRPINFIETVWHYLSPFSAHQISIWGETFATVEHAYHWARYKPGPERDAVKNATSAVECLYLSHKLKPRKDLQIQDFDKEAVMEELFRTKLRQHPHVAEILKLSGTRGLLKEIPSDYFWGTGADGSGTNVMGKLWMKLREELK